MDCWLLRRGGHVARTKDRARRSRGRLIIMYDEFRRHPTKRVFDANKRSAICLTPRKMVYYNAGNIIIVIAIICRYKISNKESDPTGFGLERSPTISSFSRTTDRRRGRGCAIYHCLAYLQCGSDCTRKTAVLVVPFGATRRNVAASDSYTRVDRLLLRWRPRDTG